METSRFIPVGCCVLLFCGLRGLSNCGKKKKKLDWKAFFPLSVVCNNSWPEEMLEIFSAFLPEFQPAKKTQNHMNSPSHGSCLSVCLRSSGCVLNRQDVRLILHYDRGFTVKRESGESVLFHFPYERLKMSADDGVRNLYLDFGAPEGEMVWPVRHTVWDLPVMKWAQNSGGLNKWKSVGPDIIKLY